MSTRITDKQVLNEVARAQPVVEKGNKKKRVGIALHAIDTSVPGACIGGITIVAETVTVSNHFHF